MYIMGKSRTKHARYMTDSITSNQSAEPDSTLQRLSAALEAGNIKQAHRLKSGFLKYAANSYPRGLTKKFHRLDAKLKELENWQQYATNSKRLELCKKMENLKNHNEIHPDEKAKAIQELQQQWRQLGPSDSNEAQKLWKRFKLAGDLAFSVCATYFSSRRDRREQNLRERNKICDSLSLYLAENDWQSTNWKAVSQIVKTARSEWKRFDDIPHASRKEMNIKFFQVLGSIEDKLKKEQHRNHQLKQGYIQQVQVLLESANNMATTVHEIKNIQHSWKQVGVTDRGTDQKLWAEFRRHCDAIFARRDEEKLQQEQMLAAETEKANELCRKLESLLNDDLQVESFQKVNKSFLSLVTGRKNPAQHRFEQLRNRAYKILISNEKRKDEKALNELIRKVDLCEQLETGTNLEIIKTQWRSKTKLSEELERMLDERYQRAQSGNYHYASMEIAEELCVRMEILAHINSPESSQGIRIKLQVERLDRQLSKGIKENRSKSEQLKDLQIQWYSLGPIQQDANELKKRFIKAGKAIASDHAGSRHDRTPDKVMAESP